MEANAQLQKRANITKIDPENERKIENITKELSESKAKIVELQTELKSAQMTIIENNHKAIEENINIKKELEKEKAESIILREQLLASKKEVEELKESVQRKNVEPIKAEIKKEERKTLEINKEEIKKEDQKILDELDGLNLGWDEPKIPIQPSQPLPKEEEKSQIPNLLHNNIKPSNIPDLFKNNLPSNGDAFFEQFSPTNTMEEIHKKADNGNEITPKKRQKDGMIKEEDENTPTRDCANTPPTKREFGNSETFHYVGQGKISEKESENKKGDEKEGKKIVAASLIPDDMF